MTEGRLKPGDRVVEYTAGSTGIALAFVCAVLGPRFLAAGPGSFEADQFGARVVRQDGRPSAAPKQGHA